MKELHSLLHCLNRKEHLLVDKYLRCLPGRKEVRDKYLRLATLVMSDKENVPGAAHCAKLVMGWRDPSPFQRLKRQLRAHIQDALLSQMALKKASGLSHANKALVRIRKKAALFTYFLYSKRSIPMARRLLDEVIAEAKAHEFYYLLIEHLHLRKWMIGLREGSELFHAANKEIEHFQNCARALDKAVDSYYTVVMLENEQARPDQRDLGLFLEKAIAETSIDAQTTRSASVGYYLNWLRLCYCNVFHRHQEGKSICLDTLRLFDQFTFLRRADRESFVLDNLANCEIHLGHYRAAARYCSMAQQKGLRGINLFASKEVEFIAWFREGDLKRAQKSLKGLKEHLMGDLGAMRHAKCSYYQACLRFAQRDYREARNLLLLHTDISSDKTGWETGIRLLLVMCFINLRQADQAIRALDNLKKFIERRRKEKSSIRKRDEAILYVLQRLEKCGFNFSNLDEKGRKKLEALCAATGDLAWTHYSSELVKFHEWALSKMPKRKLAN